SQLEKNYGKEGAEIIVDNTQLTIFGGFAPQSTSAETLSKALGSRTVMSGSVSRSKNDPSESLQMIERPLMTPDELKSMPKGQFVVMKTGFYPMKVKLKLFFKWGIHFDEEHPYTVSDQGNREVKYASKKDITDGIIKKYHPELLEPATLPNDESSSSGQNQQMTEHHQPASIKKNDEKDKNGGTALQTVPKTAGHRFRSRQKTRR
ncbi:TraM recognition domain-containing protein, partial [Phocea massiliensis]